VTSNEDSRYSYHVYRRLNSFDRKELFRHVFSSSVIFSSFRAECPIKTFIGEVSANSISRLK
ncbi:MAG TPA: hypothetical protein VI461_00565, partial [Chitinophagaceae bacterium]|nr:hypothetical protein [Chitinophagaceae bacterium]